MRDSFPALTKERQNTPTISDWCLDHMKVQSVLSIKLHSPHITLKKCYICPPQPQPLTTNYSLLTYYSLSYYLAMVPFGLRHQPVLIHGLSHWEVHHHQGCLVYVLILQDFLNELSAQTISFSFRNNDQTYLTTVLKTGKLQSLPMES